MSRSSYLSATKKWTKKLHKTIKALEELRAEAPDRMLEHINDQLGEEIRAGIRDGVKSAQIVETASDVAEGMKETVEAEVRINGRPTFTKFYDRFLWDLENDMVDETTLKLKEKYTDAWEMAHKEYERRRVS